MKKRVLGWLGYVEHEILPSYIRDYFISHEIRIPIKQPGFNGKYPRDMFFSWLSSKWRGVVFSLLRDARQTDKRLRLMTLPKNHENQSGEFPENNSSLASENRVSQKERILFQPLIFRGRLLGSGRVTPV